MNQQILTEYCEINFKIVYDTLSQYSNKDLVILQNLLNVHGNIAVNREKLVFDVSKEYHKVILSSLNTNVHGSVCSNKGVEP